MSVYGIDISTTKIAIAKLSMGDYSVVEFRSKSRSWETRLEQLYHEFFGYVAENITTEDTVFIEDIPYVQNRAAVIRLVHVQAMCKVVCIHHNLSLIHISEPTRPY